MGGFVKLRKKVPITMKRLGTKLPQLVPIDVPFPLPGLHFDRPRDQIPAGSAIDVDGITLRNGALERAPGRSYVGSSLGSDVVLLTNYLTTAGVLDLMAATEDGLYKYTTSWANIPKSPAGDMGGTSWDLFWSAQIGEDLLFCQGVDQVYRYSGGSDFAILNANCPIAKFGIGHQGRLLLVNTTESGIGYPYRVRWNVIDDIEDWTGPGSGYTDLDDKSDAVVCVGLLNDYPVVFKESSIAVGNRTGQISPAYEFLERDSINGTGCPHAVVNLGDRLAYIGSDNIYTFDLNKSTPIGDPVKAQFFDELNPQYKDQCIGYLVPDLDEVRFCIPVGDSTYNNREWIWNRKDNVWYRRNRETKAVAIKDSTTSPTWDDLSSVTWDSMVQRWNSGGLQPESSKFVMGTVSGYVYEEDQTARSLAGTAFESFYETGDIRIDASKYTGVSYVELFHKDVGVPCSITVGVSNDGGVNWSEDTRALTVGTSSGRILKKLFFKILSGTHLALRLYVSSATAHFEITGIRLWMTTAGK